MLEREEKRNGKNTLIGEYLRRLSRDWWRSNEEARKPLNKKVEKKDK